jgi:hypothetical protein
MAKDCDSVSVATGAQQAGWEQWLLGARPGKCVPGQAEDERRNCCSGHLCQAQPCRNIDRGTPLFHGACQPGGDGLNGVDAPGGRRHVGAQFWQGRGSVGVPDHIGVGPAEVGDVTAAPRCATSARRAYVNASTPDFGAQYALIMGAAAIDAGEAI